MENEIYKEKSWFLKHWKWLTPLFVVVVVAIVLAISLMSAGTVSDFASALSEDKLYQGAIDKANKNAEVQNVLGTLEPLDNMAIVESTVHYSDNKKAVNLSVRVSGDKGKAKMDIEAKKEANQWKYDLIKVRVKEPKQEIVITE